jgi:hypothetical protein
VSKKRKLTRRRDDDPVRVYDDGRILYWTGGAPGVGDRKGQRCGSREAAELRATLVRKQLLLLQSAPKANATLDDLMRAAVKYWRKVGHPTGTIQQYRSDWNTHVPPKIGAVPCREVDISHYTAIFNQLNEKQTSEQVIDAVARTLGAVVIKFGVLNGYFPDGQPFGPPPTPGPHQFKGTGPAGPDRGVTGPECGDRVERHRASNEVRQGRNGQEHHDPRRHRGRGHSGLRPAAARCGVPADAERRRPVAAAAYGGRATLPDGRLPRRYRLASLATAVVLSAIGWLLLLRGGVVGSASESSALTLASWGFAGLFAVNTAGNLTGRHPAERWGMGALTACLTVLCVLLAIG